jgi:hypothetical protein
VADDENIKLWRSPFDSAASDFKPSGGAVIVLATCSSRCDKSTTAHAFTARSKSSTYLRAVFSQE